MNIYFKEFYSNNIIKLDIKSNEYYNDSTKNFTLKLLKLFISKKYNLILDMIDILENNILCKDYDKIINFSNSINPSIYSLNIKLVGGKGGFGSLLKGQPAVKKRTKNFESCRDLSGRRIRHVNQEKQMEDYIRRQKEEKLIIEQYTSNNNIFNTKIPNSILEEIDVKNNNYEKVDSQVTKSVLNAFKNINKKRKKDICLINNDNNNDNNINKTIKENNCNLLNGTQEVKINKIIDKLNNLEEICLNKDELENKLFEDF